MLRSLPFKSADHRRRVIAVAVSIVSCLVLGPHIALRLLTIGIVDLEHASPSWVIVTQDGDCERPLQLAKTFGRVLRWEPPVEVTHLILGPTSATRGVDGVRTARAGPLRAFLLGWTLRSLGWTRTPLVLRLSPSGVSFDIHDLNDVPLRSPR